MSPSVGRSSFMRGRERARAKRGLRHRSLRHAVGRHSRAHGERNRRESFLLIADSTWHLGLQQRTAAAVDGVEFATVTNGPAGPVVAGTDQQPLAPAQTAAILDLVDFQQALLLAFERFVAPARQFLLP